MDATQVSTTSRLSTLGYQGAECDATEGLAVVHRCERIRAILQTRPQRILSAPAISSRSALPSGSTARNLFRGCRGNERGRNYNPQPCEKHRNTT